MTSFTNLLVAASVISHVVLLLYLQANRTRMRDGRGLLSAALISSMATAAALLLPANPVSGAGSVPLNSAVQAVLLAVTITLYGALVLRDIGRGIPRLELAIGLLWAASMLALSLLPSLYGQPDWLAQVFNRPDPFSVAVLAGLILMGLILLGSAFYAFYAAPLPEVANRALFWVMGGAVILLGMVLTISGSQALLLIGLLALLVGLLGATYALVSYRVFDIRGSLGLALETLVLVALTALMIFVALYTADTLNLISSYERVLLMILIAVGAALLYVPIYTFVRALSKRITNGTVLSPTQATREYSQQVSKAVDMDQLAEIASITLNRVLQVRRAGLLLVNESGNSPGVVEISVMPGAGFAELKDYDAFVAKSSSVYQWLAVRQHPIAQFDLEYSPEYKDQNEVEKQFFRGLGMSAYAPIIVENNLIGILACGPKANDALFYPRDLELLATMANQTGVALRNARLLTDMRRLNENMKGLNKGLEEANTQLEKMDAVKTDFVTIASHELRTPLAQIRGYTDILDALNEQGMLDPVQIGGMTSNLRKASERMEELIAAMLDVSQLDVNAMDLRMTQTAPESVLRMAIEPLTEAIKQRKLTLSARGLRGLPNIQADPQRLVQAFRNVVVNSIKFTPDGGKIDITAALQPPQKPGDKEHILVMIADSGVGIDAENLSLIFEKFFRAYDPGTHSTGTYKFLGAGPGLGLTIARGVIEAHGGKIWAESPGHDLKGTPGTTFYVLLPVSPPEDARRVLAIEGGA